MFKLIDVFWAYILLSILILVGRFIRQRVQLVRSLFLPSSIVAGVLALLLGSGVLGAAVRAVNPLSPLAEGVFPQVIRDVWAQSPSIFINIVFACLFLGEVIPGLGDIWRKASPQIALGQIFAWGQYVVGLLLALLVLTPLFGMNPIAGTLIEVTFEGGHGTAAGMSETFRELGFEAGADLALALATVGIVSGIIAGTWLIDWGRRAGHIQVSAYGEPEPTDEEGDSVSADLSVRTNEAPSIREARARLWRDLMIDPLTLNFGFVGLAVVIGWFILEALKLMEALTWGTTGLRLMVYVPLFPMSLIGGIIVQLLLVRTGREYMVSRPLINRIGGVALDVTVATALAVISIATIGSNLGPFLLLSVTGITWNLFVFVVLAPRIMPTYWFERGIGDMGQSMGVTSTGLLLIRMVDPTNHSGALESFAYKQLFFEPIVGGGLFTAAAPVLVVQFGAPAILLLTTIILICWLVFGFYNFHRMSKSESG